MTTSKSLAKYLQKTQAVEALFNVRKKKIYSLMLMLENVWCDTNHEYNGKET